jgi:hypothetical protein
MVKAKKRRRKQALQEAFLKAQQQKPQENSPPRNAHALSKDTAAGECDHDDDDNTSVNSSSVEEEEETLLDSDLRTTLRTLVFLTKDANSLQDYKHSKRYKDLRRVMHPLMVAQLHSYDKGIDYRLSVTHHLGRSEWADALAALQGCRDFAQFPKQGTIQRWVRNVDACDDTCKIQLLSAILQLKHSSKGDNGNGNGYEEASEEASSNNNKHDPQLALMQARMKQQSAITTTNTTNDLTILEGWKVPSSEETTSTVAAVDETELRMPPTTAQLFESRIIYQEEASTRKPPNHYDLWLHVTTPTGAAICFCPPERRLQLPVVKHDVPFCPGAFVLENVLTAQECEKLQRAATQLGFRPDHPTSLEKPTGIDSCEWLVDDLIQAAVFQRVQAYLPANMSMAGNSHSTAARGTATVAAVAATATTGTKKKNQLLLHSLNKRWRFFRYAQDCVYRPHIDGSWPESRQCASTSSSGGGEDFYECDESGATKSYLTFLFYLNDNFEGGETRFYFPQTTRGGGMTARGVIPKRGCALVFPQGNTASLLHEGSAVTRGIKYVVRTDVLYSSK